MFTGIVEEMGRVKQIAKRDKGVRIVIEAKKVIEDVQLGDSIAVNGVCLTVTEFGSDFFCADVMSESLGRSNLKSLTSGSRVNLERAMAMGKRFGGHIVSGHIDAVGTIEGIRKEGISRIYRIKAPAEVMKYTVMKGSVAIDGISLTVSAVHDGAFEVSIIPHTTENTTLSIRSEDDMVNLEADIIGKHVENLMGFSKREQEKKKSSLSTSFLGEHGFL
ncbi:riboflavin synthase alpha chain [Peptoclostridium litorale DSM 5388]|uniref:Riboflavin synthase n=1 Tax=Peptoclostridium litorale DSM 5388 TaxID=1121324 RepID=A0A069R9M3_PEPLI|nr:riboflavin synthase [Peptoclostridium litorale]KDR93764.1 riboflavin synthase RibE [Peptoclostridium litorale DSM 5388]SIN85401.1 riboflavin synthase alpha chain [Peptoclostridium litorale DSM 5388]